MNRTLVLVRHGQSEWNKLNLFTGWKDPDLTELGVEEARKGGKLLKAEGITFDIAFTSALTRAQHTLELILEEIGQTGLKTIKDQALNERDYGDLSGLNKDEAREKWGEDQVHLWRRSYSVAPPNGESLKDTVARVVPFYVQRMLPLVLRGQSVLVAAHGNSLRGLVKFLDGVSDADIVGLNIPTAVPLVYELDDALRPLAHYYLGDPEAVAKAAAAVASQGKAR